jgi:transcriptional regulator with XRE-family HTH domain
MTHQLEIAERLAQLRRKKQYEEKRDIAQTELAEVIGATPETYSRYENGKRKIPDEAIFALAKYYEVTPGFIRYGEPTPRPDTINIGGLEIDRASIVRFSDEELAQAVREIAEQEAREQERAAPAQAPRKAVGKKRRPR